MLPSHADRADRETTMSNIGKRRATALKQDAETYTKRRREIFEAAAQLFKKNGYERTSLNDVAEALDSDRATIYYYVASKKELLHEVVCATTSRTTSCRSSILLAT